MSLVHSRYDESHTPYTRNRDLIYAVFECQLVRDSLVMVI